ncbi:cyclin-dependent kinase 5 activator 1 [Platysternon megacephalum]|uniref:Cyclin-dependent kinase 5 activator 1 n=1 Tax=Platysternon megacephalum TaxID=55544 RepID=A0A4D9E4Y8_9SAUR|nr:cyclin-dependent kinase 5 activator 1 [Platysternon megacephalum]
MKQHCLSSFSDGEDASPSHQGCHAMIHIYWGGRRGLKANKSRLSQLLTWYPAFWPCSLDPYDQSSWPYTPPCNYPHSARYFLASSCRNRSSSPQEPSVLQHQQLLQQVRAPASSPPLLLIEDIAQHQTVDVIPVHTLNDAALPAQTSPPDDYKLYQELFSERQRYLKSRFRLSKIRDINCWTFQICPYLRLLLLINKGILEPVQLLWQTPATSKRSKKGRSLLLGLTISTAILI